MKNSITRIVSIAALTSVALLAQGGRQEYQLGNGSGSTTTPDPATTVAHEVTFLTSLLTLTTSQAAQATTLFTTALTAINTLETQITTAKTALATAIKANATSAITTQSAAIGTLEGQIIALNAIADAAFYQLLTTAQQTKLNSLSTDFFGVGLGDIHIPGGGR